MTHLKPADVPHIFNTSFRSLCRESLRTKQCHFEVLKIVHVISTVKKSMIIAILGHASLSLAVQSLGSSDVSVILQNSDISYEYFVHNPLVGQSVSFRNDSLQFCESVQSKQGEMHLLSFIFVELIRFGTLNAICRSHFTPIFPDGFLRCIGQSNSFCEAAQKCALFGKKLNGIAFLVGRNSPKFPGTDMQFWTGVNQLLVFRNKSSSGWYDINPNSPEYTTGSDFAWGKTQPDGHGPVTFYKQAEQSFHDYQTVSPTESFEIICEYGGQPLITTASVKFQSNYPVHLDKLIQPNPKFTGCFNVVISLVTKIECAFACARDIACRSVYYNELSGECFQAMYADSLLAGNLAKLENGWTRFAKTATPIFFNNDVKMNRGT
ncbi:hypothetical protein EG68_08168 [Paragonimus skrjabini miyazakii]|uniref:Uncharacterized protein n=1 Tax=Paragonimus skrjabini miyazakii TaxID=59628 RepID=A0A8S9YKM6_9TREM|nr:hypothetical protein EG68_08168 [Paragonimus skrjabini miyazakii]